MARTTAAENKKKNVRVAAGPRGKGFARSIGETLGMLFRPLVPLTILVAVYAGISYLLWRPLNGEAGAYESSAQALLNEQELGQALLSQPRPFWISPQDFKQIASDGIAAAKNHSVFEAGLSRSLAQVYERNIWVSRVRALRLGYPAHIELEIDFRKPYVRLERAAVLDRQGVALNLFADNPLLRDLPVVSGAAQRPVSIGRKTSDKNVLDALDLLAVVRDVLAQSPGNLKVSGVEFKDGRWNLQTGRGPAIYWGAFTDDPPIDEPRTAEKAALLRRRLCESKDPMILESIKVYIAQAPVVPRAL